MEKICTKCGKEYSKDMKFCVICGSNLTEKKIEELPKNTHSLTTNSQQDIQKIKPSKTFAFKKTKPIEKIVIPALIIAVILSIVAIILPMVLEESNLASDSVGTDEIANNSVTGGKILDGSITDDDISNIGLSKFKVNSVTGQIILDGTIDTNDLSDNAIHDLSGLILIENDSITGNKIANGTIDTVDIKNDSITSEKIVDGTITSLDIGLGAISTEKIANDSVTYNKMDIKIKYGTRSGTYNKEVVSHGIGSKPSSVIVTPIYDASILGGNYSIYANVYSINPNTFTIGLWYITFTPLEIHEITDEPGEPFSSGVGVNWIAIL